MRVLVTGHEGYIGSALVPLLQSSGHEVVGLDAGWYEGCDFGSSPSGAVSSIRLDIRDMRPDVLEGYQAVIHLAAISNDPVGDLAADTTYSINHRASVRLAELAKEAGVERFIFASSCSLYGRAPGDDPLDESADFNPVTPYGESKVLTEQGVRPLADAGFVPVFMRNATVYGPSPRLRLDVVVNDLVANAVTSGEVLVKSDGTPWRPLVHVEDVCRTAVTLLDAPADLVRGEAFNVGRDMENYRVSEVAEIVAEAVPGSRIVFAEGGGPDSRSYRVDFGKLAKTFPELELTGTVASGADELRDAFVQEGFAKSDLRGSRYVRLRRIKEHQEAGRMDHDLRWTTTPSVTR